MSKILNTTVVIERWRGWRAKNTASSIVAYGVIALCYEQWRRQDLVRGGTGLGAEGAEGDGV